MISTALDNCPALLSCVAVHEWLSIAFGAAIVTHLLLHWQWIANSVKRLVVRQPARRLTQPDPGISAQSRQKA